jgi:hypothetical protein
MAALIEVTMAHKVRYQNETHPKASKAECFKKLDRESTI